MADVEDLLEQAGMKLSVQIRPSRMQDLTSPTVLSEVPE